MTTYKISKKAFITKKTILKTESKKEIETLLKTIHPLDFNEYTIETIKKIKNKIITNYYYYDPIKKEWISHETFIKEIKKIIFKNIENKMPKTELTSYTYIQNEKIKKEKEQS